MVRGEAVVTAEAVVDVVVVVEVVEVEVVLVDVATGRIPVEVDPIQIEAEIHISQGQ